MFRSRPTYPVLNTKVPRPPRALPCHATASGEQYGTHKSGPSWRYEVMTASRRWQDYATMVFGVLLFISPFVFGETSHHLSTIGPYVLGVLLLLSWIVSAATPEP